MIRTLASAAVIAAASLSYTAAYADDFPATPMQHGAPTDLPGEKLIPGLSEAMATVNTMTPPIVLPELLPLK